MDRTTRYPQHLAKLVAERLRREHGNSPPGTVLARLLETLYFASLKTDEGRRVLCTVDYVDPESSEVELTEPARADRWSYARFDRSLPFDVRSVAKVARAADPEVSSLAVYSDRKHRLFIWAMVDQEPRYGEAIALDAPANLERPGLFQATIVGPGNISVYHRGILVGSLVQNALVEEYHNVLWSGPVYAILKDHLHWSLAHRHDCNAGLRVHEPPETATVPTADAQPSELGLLRNGLLLRWINAVCRILVNIQHYRHGGGLLIVPHGSLDGLNINYRLSYDRLLTALAGLVHYQWAFGRSGVTDGLRSFYRGLDEHRKEVLGAIRFIASLASVDGVVLLDRSLCVQGFGVELRTDNPLNSVFLAGDAAGSPELVREVELTHFGTRHRAMMRYCHEREGALGFVVSQDGEIQAMTRIGPRLLMWENIDVQLALAVENQLVAGQAQTPVWRRFIARVA
jgi:hypothetical protein